MKSFVWFAGFYAATAGDVLVKTRQLLAETCRLRATPRMRWCRGVPWGHSALVVNSYALFPRSSGSPPTEPLTDSARHPADPDRSRRLDQSYSRALFKGDGLNTESLTSGERVSGVGGATPLKVIATNPECPLNRPQSHEEWCAGLDDADKLDLAAARTTIRRRLTPFLQDRGVRLDY